MKSAQTNQYTLRDFDLTTSDSSDYVLRVRDLEENDKPREKLSKLGPAALKLSEIIAIIIGSGTKKEEVLHMAARVVREYGETALLRETNPAKLAESLDIPPATAARLVASFELGRRYFAQKAGKPAAVRNTNQAFDYLKDMGMLKKEVLRGLYLNSRYEVIHDEVLSVGSVTASIVHPREVFAPALEFGAVAMILAHNHPSGSLEPTAADRAITQQLRSAGELLGIDLLDHLIIAHENFGIIK